MTETIVRETVKAPNTKTETTKVENVKPETIKIETIKTESAKTDSSRSDAIAAVSEHVVKVLPAALVYHLTLPYSFDFLPEVTESLGMKVALKNTNKSSYDYFTDYVKGDLKYVHIEDDEQRRMNDWMTAWITVSASWPYIPILGLVGAYRLGTKQAELINLDERVGGVASLFLNAPFNILFGIYEAANYNSAKIREQGLDVAMVEAFSKLPQVLGAGVSTEEKSHKKDAFSHIAATTTATMLLAPYFPLMGSYKITNIVGDLTHKNRPMQFASTLLGAPLLAMFGLPYFSLLQSTTVASDMAEQSGLSNWLGKFLSDAGKTFDAVGKK